MQSWLILIQSAFITAYYSLKLIIKKTMGSLTRQAADKRLRAWARVLLNAARVKCRVINPHHVEPQNGQVTIIMSNHASLYDIPLCYEAFPKHTIRMLAKKELGSIPFIGGAMKVSEFPLINRRNKKEAIENLNTAKQLMENGIVIWIFPEGTRSSDGRLAPLKKGAFVTALETHATIIPVGIRGAYNILPTRTFDLHLNQTAEIHIGKPIDTTAYSLNERQTLIDLVYHQIKTLSGQV